MSAITHSTEVPASPARWGTVNQLCQRYPLSRSRAYRLLAEGKLKARKMSGRTIWDLASAEQFFAELPEYEQAA